MSLDFTALDFETANSHRGSPCAVGVTRVRAGVVAETFATLMRPPSEFDYFQPWNTLIHGITADHVRDAPTFGALWPQLLDFVGDDLVVAHNASFDLGVVREACTASRLQWPAWRYACTLVLARQTYDLLSYSLPFVTEAAGLSQLNHHVACADAEAAALVMLDIANRSSCMTLDELLAKHDVRSGVLHPKMWSGCRRVVSAGRRRPPEANADADPDHPLFGEVVVFTGALQTMTRSVAWENVAFVGGQPMPNPTRRTTILVEGLQDPSRFRPGMTLSAKAEKARILRANGYPIEIMGEPEFLALLADARASGFAPDVVDEECFHHWLEATENRAEKAEALVDGSLPMINVYRPADRVHSCESTEYRSLSRH